MDRRPAFVSRPPIGSSSLGPNVAATGAQNLGSAAGYGDHQCDSGPWTGQSCAHRCLAYGVWGWGCGLPLFMRWLPNPPNDSPPQARSRRAHRIAVDRIQASGLQQPASNATTAVSTFESRDLPTFHRPQSIPTPTQKATCNVGLEQNLQRPASRASIRGHPRKPLTCHRSKYQARRATKCVSTQPRRALVPCSYVLSIKPPRQANSGTLPSLVVPRPASYHRPPILP